MNAKRTGLQNRHGSRSAAVLSCMGFEGVPPRARSEDSTAETSLCAALPFLGISELSNKSTPWLSLSRDVANDASTNIHRNVIVSECNGVRSLGNSIHTQLMIDYTETTARNRRAKKRTVSDLISSMLEGLLRSRRLAGPRRPARRGG